MMIRDTGDWIQFWLKAGPQTFNHQLPWAYSANGGTTGWGSFDFQSGGNWQNLGAVYVTSSQNVTFKLGASGTSGLGGPTDFTQYISRSSIPSPPSLAGPYNIGPNSFDVAITNGADNGSPIDTRQIGWGTDPWNTQHTANADWWAHVLSLAPGTTYYVWARTHNALGWSGWSNRISAVTLRVPDAPNRPALTTPSPQSVTVSWTPNGNGGATIAGYQVGYGTSSVSPTTVVSSTTASKTISGLLPGTIYFFWVRAQNSVGTSPWSPANGIRTLASARVLVEAVLWDTPWRQAVPYVKVGGVWKPAQPYIRVSGTWKQTS
jgi:hypothetical protein